MTSDRDVYRRGGTAVTTMADLIARMAGDARFAEDIRAHPARLVEEFGLSAEEAQMILALKDGAEVDGPAILHQRLSKSAIGAFGMGSLFHALGPTEAPGPDATPVVADAAHSCPDIPHVIDGGQSDGASYHVLQPQEHSTTEADTITHNPDGTSTTETVEADGTRIDVVTDASDRFVSQTEYGPDGAQTGHLTYDAAGHPTGTGVVHLDTYGSDTPVTITFHDDGSYTEHASGTGFTTDTDYDSHGERVSMTTRGQMGVVGGRYPSDATSTTTFEPTVHNTTSWDDADGHHVITTDGYSTTRTETITAPDGSTRVDTWAGGHVVQSTTTGPDGTSTTTHDDTSGHPADGVTVTHNPDGTTTTETVQADGSRVDVVTNASGDFVSQTEYGADGTQTGHMESGPGGDMVGSGVVHSDDYSGAITITFHDDGTYTVHESSTTYSTDTTYDSHGARISVTTQGAMGVVGGRYPSGATSVTTYSPTEQTTTSWDDTDGHHTVTTVDFSTTSTETITGPDGTTTVDTWVGGHMVQTTVTDPDGTSTTTHYDSAGHPIAGGADAVTHNPDGTTTTETIGPDGSRIDVVTDPSGRVISQTEYGPDGSQTGHVTYSAGGDPVGTGVVHVSSYGDPNPTVITFHSDGGYTVEHTDRGYVTDDTYDSHGNHVSQVGHGWVGVVGGRHVQGTSTTTYSPTEQNTTSWDDADGHHDVTTVNFSTTVTETITAPDGTTTVDTWVGGHMVESAVTHPDGTTTTTQYDTSGNVISSSTDDAPAADASSGTPVPVASVPAPAAHASLPADGTAQNPAPIPTDPSTGGEGQQPLVGTPLLAQPGTDDADSPLVATPVLAHPGTDIPPPNNDLRLATHVAPTGTSLLHGTTDSQPLSPHIATVAVGATSSLVAPHSDDSPPDDTTTEAPDPSTDSETTAPSGKP